MSSFVWTLIGSSGDMGFMDDDELEEYGACSADIFSYRLIVCVPDPNTEKVPMQVTKLLQEIIDMIICYVCTDDCPQDFIFHVLAMLTAKHLVLTARCFLKGMQMALYQHICMTFAQLTGVWMDILVLNPSFPIAICTLELVTVEDNDMMPLSSFLPIIEQGFALSTIILKHIEFDNDIVSGLASLVPCFKTLIFEGCTYNEQEFNTLLRLCLASDELRMGITDICTFTGCITEGEDELVVDPASPTDPIQSFSYNTEGRLNFLTEHPIFTCAMQPRLCALHILFIHANYQAYEFMQGIVTTSRKTLQVVDVVDEAGDGHP
ncbi:hypothetical protein ARMGADRAFT_1090301 [Armillaria gallica]|uniref:F-box domain-containing protein n=1 Tax=Armillaria gallica TaxID=47427 RepID=A0A2H3CM44_ARMGA|nr:hypothetical protein ARMGADRAFT_1090301 [Armillaria gallica]